MIKDALHVDTQQPLASSEVLVGVKGVLHRIVKQIVRLSHIQHTILFGEGGGGLRQLNKKKPKGEKSYPCALFLICYLVFGRKHNFGG
jgi:hypothetical protein